ncbi:single-stranded DNA-binding protein [Methylomagnum ishizawai]|uniref:single-stranded DNA-binding protein n=1 Tax=Methylomagnum ishizawai TaxID=1760988 RepID=UPI001C337EF8|nr:single-stranded DNA-binding protein [Methylomagnum ishizawai]BBL74574.1 hypothetical protein MishRS11D_16720 [Methylomagnum ishizawai]
MLDVLLSGKLSRDPLVRVGPSGRPFTTAQIRVPVEGDETLWVSTIAFGEVGERLGRLKAGDAVSLAGSAKLSSWEKDGELRHGLSVTASGILSIHETREVRETRKRREPKESPGRAAPAEPPPGRETGGEVEFDDEIPF